MTTGPDIAIATVTMSQPTALVQLFLDRASYMNPAEFVTYLEQVQAILIRNIADGATYIDQIAMNDQPMEADAAAMSEHVTMSFIKQIDEVITMIESVSVTGRQFDSAAMSDAVAMTFVQAPTQETSTTSDSVSMATVKSVTDASATTDGGYIGIENYVAPYAGYFAENYVLASKTTF